MRLQLARRAALTWRDRPVGSPVLAVCLSDQSDQFIPLHWHGKVSRYQAELRLAMIISEHYSRINQSDTLYTPHYCAALLVITVQAGR